MTADVPLLIPALHSSFLHDAHFMASQLHHPAGWVSVAAQAVQQALATDYSEGAAYALPLLLPQCTGDANVLSDAIAHMTCLRAGLRGTHALVCTCKSKGAQDDLQCQSQKQAQGAATNCYIAVKGLLQPSMPHAYDCRAPLGRSRLHGLHISKHALSESPAM